MLSAAKHLSAERERPFATLEGDMAQGDTVGLVNLSRTIRPN
jgi:hypothetical protein